MLFVPADQEAKVHKATGLPCDGVILDLEDGVSAPRKVDARIAALAALGLSFGPRERLLRINALTSPWGSDDLAALRDARVLPDTVVLPKVDTPEQVLTVARALDGKAVDLLPHIETARGLLAAAVIAGCHQRVSGLFFGAGDYLVETGGQRTPQTLLHPRSVVVAAAAASHIVAIDTPYFRLGDLAGLEADAVSAAELGFVGKAAIHPEQLPVLNRVFAPPPERVAWAERVMATAEQAGTGVFVVDGEMADAMTVRIARRVLAAARALPATGDEGEGREG
ncbi:MAG: HpcH/HpaI aldolase/citrate lyase family protein [Armatimonadota bacterium]